MKNLKNPQIKPIGSGEELTPEQIDLLLAAENDTRGTSTDRVDDDQQQQLFGIPEDVSAFRDEKQSITSNNIPKNTYRSAKKEYFDKPFIKNQYKTMPNTCRLKRTVVNVYNLDDKEDLEKFNGLLNDCAQEFTNITNLRHQIKFTENTGTWKVLVLYDVLEFENPTRG